MFDYLVENWGALLAALVAIMVAFRHVVRLTPTKKDDEVFDKVNDTLDSIIPNYKLPEEEEKENEKSE